jgi:NADPH-dependent 2,4-dienoyl-CoA reductase/sulfur reductase-like enzyme
MLLNDWRRLLLRLHRQNVNCKMRCLADDVVISTARKSRNTLTNRNPSPIREGDHVVIVGAGVMGITTAYYLLQRGFKVTVIDRNNEVSHETSFQNGGTTEV